ncbi:MAG: hypothetical protein CGU28_17160 [Candidatus Dactylopiibacterium carminicum]|uniref:Glycosyltransferase 2-like domain-containing protein n=1 Tax=Candidatus Dactylopiibacterium carminicum TaxID=857335 RepID=A0A272EMD4_9RHOO|nr:glycosyltransferase [Candidatus Dactylopiibacterium carminicum]KAF7597674.1 hypothetical protein BGI27_17535 [Candidatus Dactylopiibacterium carminicum]PAS91289.1 MAG: hypothetical protein CGU29_17275 [Candidatus Dactylopiibacterium carminicum]PAS91976.1 MAG: hypothetical protein CGU28_17160 [Candidatus Dactylopiibacterium carminicum]PAS93696.1 MAG: hypothetical protein BSR46_17585 [Candidatus Dactylopiibacterium carminicum]
MPHRRRISLVIPFYNEEENVDNTLAAISGIVDSTRYDWELIAINDGSRDATLAKLQAARPTSFELVVVDLSRNFGKEAALSAGLSRATGDAVIPLDADLQDPPELIAESPRVS